MSFVIGSFDLRIRSSTLMSSSSIYHARIQFGQHVNGSDLSQRRNDMTSSGNNLFFLIIYTKITTQLDHSCRKFRCQLLKRETLVSNLDSSKIILPMSCRALAPKDKGSNGGKRFSPSRGGRHLRSPHNLLTKEIYCVLADRKSTCILFHEHRRTSGVVSSIAAAPFSLGKTVIRRS
jgi:hypothetical protein